MVLSYSHLLDEALKRLGANHQVGDLRSQSSKIISPQLIRDVDEELVQIVDKTKQLRPVIIDSHPVTIEQFGFRITPFTTEILKRLAPDCICMLTAPSSEIRRRILCNPDNRLIPSEEQIETHFLLQSQVVVNYGMTLGVPIYLLKTENLDSTVDQIIKRISG